MIRQASSNDVLAVGVAEVRMSVAERDPRNDAGTTPATQTFTRGT
jgi:hypothetical protein